MKRRLLSIALVLLTLLPMTPSISYAKEFELDGTIDCGQPSGKLCLPVGATVGIITDQYSGKRNERVEVGMALILEQRLKKSRRLAPLLDDQQGVYRQLLFQQLQPLIAQLAALDPANLSLEEKERLVDNLFDQSLPREVATARDKLMIVASNFKQDARIRVIVSDELGPVLMVTDVRNYQDYSLAQSTSSGTLNHGQLTGDDSEGGFCTDFVKEALDFFKQRFEETGSFDLTNNEELFFELFSELPNPCNNKRELRVIEDLVVNWITWNLKAYTDDQLKDLKERTRERRERLRSILSQPGAKLKVLELLRDSILKEQPKGRAPFRNITEQRTR